MWEGGTEASIWGRGCHHSPLLSRMGCHGQLTRSRPKAWDRTISCSSFFLMYSAESTMPWGGGRAGLLGSLRDQNSQCPFYPSTNRL